MRQRDERFIELLDVARRQLSAGEFEYQTTHSLYRGDWDGLLEGPTWGAWWTQNSYGPVIASLPFLDDANWHAVQNSMAWWFNSMGNGSKVPPAAFRNQLCMLAVIDPWTRG